MRSSAILSNLARNLVAALAAALGGDLPSSADRAAPNGGRPFLPRGQAPARGVILGPSRMGSHRPVSARKLHRFEVQLAKDKRATRPDFSAQIAREAKQARGRVARSWA